MEFIFWVILIALVLGPLTGAHMRGRGRMGPGGPPPSALYGPQSHTVQRSFTQRTTQFVDADGQTQTFVQQGYGQPGMGQPAIGNGGFGQPSFGQPAFGQPAFGQGGFGQREQPLSDASRNSVDTDITRFGGELRELDLDVVGIELDEEARADYTKALDAYENAKQSLRNAELDSDATHITQILEEGRYAIECVKARAHGRTLPDRRPPCFFNPAHGPSTTDVEWAPDGGVSREVPACALDAARVRSGANPHIRMVPMVGGQMVPYWEDERQAAWARGYYEPYGTDPAIRQLTQGALMIGGFSLLMGLFND